MSYLSKKKNLPLLFAFVCFIHSGVVVIIGKWSLVSSVGVSVNSSRDVILHFQYDIYEVVRKLRSSYRISKLIQ